MRSLKFGDRSAFETSSASPKGSTMTKTHSWRPPWRIRRRVAVVAPVSCFATAAAHPTALDNVTASTLAPTPVANSITVDPNSLFLRVATYRNGYGTHFRCNSTCYFSMIFYLVTVAVMLAILFVIPVQSPSKEENAPFVLWFGNDKPDKHASGYTGSKQRCGFLDRLSMLIYGYPEPTLPQQDKIGESFHEVNAANEDPEPPKTFESIGVETDESLLPPLPSMHDDLVVEETIDPPYTDKKPGIFALLTPRSGEAQSKDINDDDSSALRRILPSPRRHSSVVDSGRRSTIAGSASSDVARDNLLVAVERRTSMQKRAEKRKEYTKSDIAHDNLHDHELHMYEYLEFVRSLLEGISIKKITQKSGKIVKRTFFITPTLNTVYWNQVGNKAWINKKSSIDTTEINRVVIGLDGSGNKVKVGKQNTCLTIVMKDGKRLELEATDEALCKRLFLGFTQLAAEKREEKRKRDAAEVDQEGRDLSGEQQ